MSKKLETESTLHDHQQDDSLYGAIPMDTSSDRYISDDDRTQEQSGSGLPISQGGVKSEIADRRKPQIPKLDLSKIKKYEEGQESVSMACKLGSDGGNSSFEERGDKTIVSDIEQKEIDETTLEASHSNLMGPRPDPERPEVVPKLNLSFTREGT